MLHSPILLLQIACSFPDARIMPLKPPTRPRGWRPRRHLLSPRIIPIRCGLRHRRRCTPILLLLLLLMLLGVSVPIGRLLLLLLRRIAPCRRLLLLLRRRTSHLSIRLRQITRRMRLSSDAVPVAGTWGTRTGNPRPWTGRSAPCQ